MWSELVSLILQLDALGRRELEQGIGQQWILLFALECKYDQVVGLQPHFQPTDREIGSRQESHFRVRELVRLGKSFNQRPSVLCLGFVAAEVSVKIHFAQQERERSTQIV